MFEPHQHNNENSNLQCLPHGKMPLLSAALAICALVFTFLALASCHFAIVNNFNACTYDGGCEMVSDLGLGITNNDYNSPYCVSYTLYDSPHKDIGDSLKVEFDGVWKMAQAFIIIAVSLGALSVIFVHSCTLCRKNCRSEVWRCLAFMYVQCSICTILALVFFASDNACGNGASCSFSVGAAYTIVGMLFWILSAICCSKLECKMQPKEQNQMVLQGPEPMQEPRVTVSVTIQPDGRQLTETRNEHPDGSTIVRVKTEMLPVNSVGSAPVAVAAPLGRPRCVRYQETWNC